MKRINGLAWMMAAFALAFVCVLLSGAGRLIAGESSQMPVVQLTAAEAYLSSGTFASQEAEGKPSGGAEMQRRLTTAEDEMPRSCAPVSTARSDANGNVLNGESYLRTVYQAFSLGDGFA